MNPENEKETILLVEDSEDFLDIYGSRLNEGGFNCLTASTAKGAISILKEKNGAIKLVLLDWKLTPPETGGEVLKFCREKLPETIVIVMSGLDRDLGIIVESLVNEADGFLPKQIGPTLVLWQVRRWFSRLNFRDSPYLPRSEKEVQKLDDVKRRYVIRALELCGGNKSKAGQLLDIDDATVRSYIKEDKSQSQLL